MVSFSDKILFIVCGSVRKTIAHCLDIPGNLTGVLGISMEAYRTGSFCGLGVWLPVRPVTWDVTGLSVKYFFREVYVQGMNKDRNIGRTSASGSNSESEKQNNCVCTDARSSQRYKDSFFTALFREKKYAAMLYRELHPEDIRMKDDDVEIITLNNVFLIDMYNDAAFRVKDRLIVLVEHQSGFSYNMPLRMLFYVAEEYKRWLGRTGNLRKLHGKTLIKIPAPEFYVVYTGAGTCPGVLQLRDAFDGSVNTLNLMVDVICDPQSDGVLKEYVAVVKKIESLIKMGIERSVAIKTVIREYAEGNFVISDFLKRRTDIVNLINDEFTFEDKMAVMEEEAMQQGMRQGMRQGMQQVYFAFIRKQIMKGIPKEKVADAVVENFDVSFSDAVHYVDLFDKE